MGFEKKKSIIENKNFDQDSNIPLRGDVQKFFKMKLNTVFLRMVYPGVITRFLTENDFETAKRLMWDLGYRVSRYIFNYFIPKSNKFVKIIEEFGKKIWGTTFKIKFDKTKKSYLIKPRSCPLCEDLPPFDVEGLHNCFPLEGFLIGYFELLKEHNLFNYSEISAKTLQSKGTGADSCIYEVKIIR
ncbi:MAG: hypothetical protein HWN65_05055 [Candidatus Helarchaeota archaeon]|nr:hypothetical protein [Candidatus Helarchaeota archaeon]